MDLATQPSPSPRLQPGSVAHFFRRSLPRLAFILAAVACLSWATGCGDDTTDDPQNEGGSGGTDGAGGTGGNGGSGGTGGTDNNEGGSGGTDTTEASFSLDAQTFTATLGAGSGVAPVCYDFDSDQEVDCEDDAATWDLMFELAGRSYNIWTNGGVKGSGGGGAFGPMTTQDAGEVLSAKGLSFSADDESPVLINDGGEESWFKHSLVGGASSFAANPNVWWAIRSAEGDSFAKMHVIEMESSTRSFTVEVFVQPKAE